MEPPTGRKTNAGTAAVTERGCDFHPASRSPYLFSGLPASRLSPPLTSFQCAASLHLVTAKRLRLSGIKMAAYSTLRPLVRLFPQAASTLFLTFSRPAGQTCSPSTKSRRCKIFKQPTLAAPTPPPSPKTTISLAAVSLCFGELTPPHLPDPLLPPPAPSTWRAS